MYPYIYLFINMNWIKEERIFKKIYTYQVIVIIYQYIYIYINRKYIDKDSSVNNEI